MIRALKKALDIATMLLMFSGLIDLYLWLSVEAMIPSWTMTAMALGTVILIQVLKRTVK